MKGTGKRSLAVLLAILMMVGMMVPVSAADIEDVSMPDFLWELDFNDMTDMLDNGGSDEFSLQAPASNNRMAMTEFQGDKVLGIKNASGQYYVVDENNILDTYDTFFIEAELEHLFPWCDTLEICKKHREMGISSQWKVYTRMEHGFFYELQRNGQKETFEDICLFLEGKLETI